MAKVLNIKDNGVTYTLEYTRRTVEDMERSGFIVGEVFDKPATMIPALFHGAFRAHHPKLKPQHTKEIYDRMTGKKELIGKLAEMYNEPISALLDDPEETDGKNPTWTASW